MNHGHNSRTDPSPVLRESLREFASVFIYQAKAGLETGAPNRMQLLSENAGGQIISLRDVLLRKAFGSYLFLEQNPVSIKAAWNRAPISLC
jgi:hypothetical protein